MEYHVMQDGVVHAIGAYDNRQAVKDRQALGRNIAARRRSRRDRKRFKAEQALLREPVNVPVRLLCELQLLRFTSGSIGFWIPSAAWRTLPRTRKPVDCMACVAAGVGVT